MTSEDIESVASIYQDAFNNSPVQETWTIEMSKARITKTFEEQCSFVAIEDTVVVGALIGYSCTFDTGPTFYIEGLVVKESKRTHGIGEQLIERAFEVAKEKKMTSIQLQANAKLQSFHWYKRLGFQESGWIDLVKTLV